eukprot:403368440
MALRSRASPAFSNCNSAVTSMAIRGPKKKKGAVAAAAPESSDIVNIWKDRQDCQIFASDRYPPWLMRLLDENYSPDDIMMQIYRGERLPTGAEQWTMAKAFKRTYMQDMNRMVRDDWEYESDDDIGEDIGKFEEEEAEVSIEGGAAAAGGEGGAAAGGEKKEGEKKEGGDAKDAGK